MNDSLFKQGPTLINPSMLSDVVALRLELDRANGLLLEASMRESTLGVLCTTQHKLLLRLIEWNKAGCINQIQIALDDVSAHMDKQRAASGQSH